MAKTEEPDLSGQLTFDTDKGAAWSKGIAVLLALALVGWMGSGYVYPSETEEEVAEDTAPRPVAVAVMASDAQDIELVLTVEGQAEPDRASAIQAKRSGQVTSVSVNRGALVDAGQEIGRIDSGTFEAQLTQAQTQLEQASTDLRNALQLQERGIATEDRVLQARAAKAAAEAAVTAAQQALDDTIIRAPFAGRLNEMSLDEGEFVNAGDRVAEVLDNDPLTIVVQVPQQALSRLTPGQLAQVSFITGETRPGIVGFIGNNADTQTRTFRVEVAVENPGSTMPAGLSSRIILPTGKARGHFISPAILSLSTSGELGVKTVDAENRVVFAPVNIVRAQTDGVWVTGLPDVAQIITVGQGYVNDGDLVDPKLEDQAKLARVQP